MANTAAIVATRAFGLYYKLFDVSNAMPADTVLYGTTPTGFTDVGYTSGGLTFGVDQTRNEIRVDQEFFPVANPITEVSITLGAELAEITPANMKFATGLGAITSVAGVDSTPGPAARGHDDWDVTSVFDDSFYTVMARAKQNDNEVVNIALWKALATSSMSASITADDAATIAVEYQGLVDTSTTPGRIATVRDVSAIPAG